MASSSSALFFENGTNAQFEFVLSKYKEALEVKARKKSNKPETLLKLDNWYQNDLPKKIKSRGKEAHLIHDELVQTIKWKLARGVFRPRLKDLVQMNTPRVVMQETKKAFRHLYKKNDLEAAVLAMSNLKGVGPAMASAVLAAGAPESAPFMADECLLSMPDMEGIDYTMKEYMKLVQKTKECCERLNSQGGEWTPHKVELAVWTHYVAKDLKPELLDGLPAANETTTSARLNGSSNKEELNGVTNDKKEEEEGKVNGEKEEETPAQQVNGQSEPNKTHTSSEDDSQQQKPDNTDNSKEDNSTPQHTDKAEKMETEEAPVAEKNETSEEKKDETSEEKKEETSEEKKSETSEEVKNVSSEEQKTEKTETTEVAAAETTEEKPEKEAAPSDSNSTAPSTENGVANGAKENGSSEESVVKQNGSSEKAGEKEPEKNGTAERNGQVNGNGCENGSEENSNDTESAKEKCEENGDSGKEQPSECQKRPLDTSSADENDTEASSEAKRIKTASSSEQQDIVVPPAIPAGGE